MTKNKPSAIVIHHSAVSRKANSRQFVAINNYHKQQFNLKSSLNLYGGYHYLIEPYGIIGRYRDDHDIGAHCYQKGMNFNSIGICLTGNFDKEKPQPEQIYALRDLLKKLCSKYKIPAEKIYFHRDFAPKTCPGKFMDKKFIQSLIK